MSECIATAGRLLRESLYIPAAKAIMKSDESALRGGRLDSTMAKHFQVFQLIAARRRGAYMRSRGLALQELEPRIALSHTASDHIHPVLRIEIDGQPVEIPANIGLEPTRHYSPHTHDTNGTLHTGEGPISGIDPLGSPRRLTTLKDFFDVWRTTNPGTPANNPNAFFSQSRILDRIADANHQVVMTVNGQVNSQFENYSPHDGDQVVIRHEAMPATSWHNPNEPTDVNGINGTTPLDALLVINELTDRRFSNPVTGRLDSNPNPPPFLDVNNDTFLSPLDALLVINALPSSARSAPLSGWSPYPARLSPQLPREPRSPIENPESDTADLIDLAIANLPVHFPS